VTEGIKKSGGEFHDFHYKRKKNTYIGDDALRVVVKTEEKAVLYKTATVQKKGA